MLLRSFRWHRSGFGTPTESDVSLEDEIGEAQPLGSSSGHRRFSLSERAGRRRRAIGKGLTARFFAIGNDRRAA